MAYKLPAISATDSVKIHVEDTKSLAEFRTKGYSERKSTDGFVFSKKLEPWEKFEKSVARLFSVLDFNDVEYGPKSRIAGYQVDAQGGFKGNYFVVSCKSSTEGKHNVRDSIRELSVRAAEMRKEVIRTSASKYSDVYFILALHGIEFTKEHLKYAREHNVTIWGNQFLSTAEKLYKAIGTRAVFHILKPIVTDVGDVPGIKGYEGLQPKANYFIVPAFKVSIESETVYHFQLPAELLLDLAYVARLTPGNEGAYQRMMVQTKLEAISQFLEGKTTDDGKPGFFKNNLIATFESSVMFNPLNTVDLYTGGQYEFGTLKIPARYGTLWLIDGQHRLYGYGSVNSELRMTPLPVAAYQDVDGSQQAEDFISINQNQKKVDNNLLWELLERIRPEESKEWAISKLGQELADSGYFAGRIYAPGSAQKEKTKYPLTLGTICRAIKERTILERLRVSNPTKYSDPKRYTEELIQEAKLVIEEFYQIVEESLPVNRAWKSNFVRKGNGFSVMFNILEEYLKLGHGWKLKDATILLADSIKSFFDSRVEDYERISSLSGYGPYRKLAVEIMVEINKKDPRFAFEVLSDDEKAEPLKMITDIETRIRKMIFQTLSGKSPEDWWNRYIPQTVTKSAAQRYKRNYGMTYDGKSEDIMKVLGFPEYKIIMFGEETNNWSKHFSPYFSKPKSWVKVQLDELREIRNKGPMHANSLESDTERKLAVVYRELKAQLAQFE